MKLEQWSYQKGWQKRPEAVNPDAQLVLLFAARQFFTDTHAPFIDLKQAYPNSTFIGCSTAGEICDTQVQDDSLVATAMTFERTQLRFVQCLIDSPEESQQIGKKIALELESPDLKHILILSEGLVINGSALTRGVQNNLSVKASISGGLAGDSHLFEKTILYYNQPQTKTVLAIGFYGDHIDIQSGSFGGWDAFGPLRKITRSQGNILYEMDHRPALELYKKYLGDYAQDLPSSGLLFPLSLRESRNDTIRQKVRTILSVDEDKGSLTFAGEVPQGHYAQLMKANMERLIDGAAEAANNVNLSEPPDLALLISCVGRKMVLKQRVEEEVEEVQSILKAQQVTGFYSYGEIAPFHLEKNVVELHNQTMTITTFKEHLT